MKTERIDIVVPQDIIDQNDAKRERLSKTHKFETTDRVPVVSNISQWAVLDARGVTAGEYVRDARSNLREQILNQKWMLENIRDDSPIPTENLWVSPDFGCLRGTEFPMKITWPENQPPKCEHPLTLPEQVDSLEPPDPAGAHNARQIKRYNEMKEAVESFDVRMNGESLNLHIGVGLPQGGPIPSAFALAGENLLYWMAAEPERAHRLMDIVTESFLNCIRYFDEMTGQKSRQSVHLGCDSAEMISPDMFREFVVPYYLRIWKKYPGRRSFHNCGKNEHLLDIIRDDLSINFHNGFGSCINPEVLAEKMSGRVVMMGGPDPILVMKGPDEAIMDACEMYIRTVGHRGGYLLGTGGSAVPGTPPEHLNLMLEAARKVGTVPITD